MKTLYIADLRSNCSNGISTGHFFPVAAMYQKLFKDFCNVVVAGGPVYKNRFKDDDLLLLPHNVSGITLKDKWHTLKNAINLFKEAKGKTIILQHSSTVTSFIVIALFYHRTSKLFMIQYSNEGVRSFIKRVLYRFAKGKIDGMICPNDEVGRAYGIPYCVVPDYIYTGSVEKVKLSGDELGLKKYDFCMVGRIAEEKGIVEAASFFARTKYKVVIAGKTQNAELDAKLRRACENASNIDLRIGYVSEAEYQDLLENSKYTILNYQGEYSRRSSGVVYDTLFAGVPVIGKKCLALQFVEDYNVGFLYPELSDLTECVLKKIMDVSTYNSFQNNIDTYKQKHLEYRNKLCQFVLRGFKSI